MSQPTAHFKIILGCSKIKSECEGGINLEHILIFFEGIVILDHRTVKLPVTRVEFELNSRLGVEINPFAGNHPPPVDYQIGAKRHFPNKISTLIFAVLYHDKQNKLWNHRMPDNGLFHCNYRN